MKDMDEIDQKVAWRSRLVRAVLRRDFDDETLVGMLEDGLQQAHSEGVLDAAHVCQVAADISPVAAMLAGKLRELNALNNRNSEDGEGMIHPLLSTPGLCGSGNPEAHDYAGLIERIKAGA